MAVGAGLEAPAVRDESQQTGGVTYTGELKDGKANGQGTYTSADGTKRTGEWKNGTRVR